MDPFMKLPPEIRIMILGRIASYATTASLTQASPVMLAQFTSSKSSPLHVFLTNMAGVGRDYNDLLQDALGIVFLNDSGNDKQLISCCAWHWSMKSFPSPFVQEDTYIIPILRRLFGRIAEYIEAYINKDAFFIPPTANLRIPQATGISDIDGKRLTLDDLTWPVLHRFFRAFIRYEILHRIYNPRVERSMDYGHYLKIAEGSVVDFLAWDCESMHIYDMLKRYL